MKKTIIISLLIIVSLNTQAQEHFELEAGTGWVFFNLINSPEYEFDNAYMGYGTQSTIDGWLVQRFWGKHDFKVGLGLTQYYFLDVSAVTPPSYYANFRIGADWQTPLEKVKFTTNLSNHIYLHKYNEDSWDFRRRVFTKLDLGLRFQMNNRLSFHVNSPLTIFPMFQNDNNIGHLIPGGEIPVDGHVELTGLNVGLIYNFKPHEKDLLKPLKTKGTPSNFGVEVSSGFLKYDIFNEDKDYINYFQGTGRQLSADVWYEKSIYDNVDLRVGLGYSNFTYEQTYLDTTKIFNTLNARIGANFQTKWKPLSINATVSNYIFLQDSLDKRFEQRVMTNLDLGATFHVTDNFDIRVTTPITIAAMINSGRWSFIDKDDNYNLVDKSYVGMSGLNIGLIYTFGKIKE
jgi:hypothetical protein